MKHVGTSLFSAILVSTLVACAPVDSEVEESLDTVDEVASNPLNLAYVTLRPDLRRCISPLCGGYWVRRVNRSTMRCVDGSYAAECYVGRVDWSGLNLDERALADFQTLAAQGRAILRGRIDPLADPQWSQIGELIAVGGWQPVTADAVTGQVWNVADAGIRCVTAPCLSLDAARVNVVSSATRLSSLDFSGMRGLAAGDATRLREAVGDDTQTVLFAGTVATAGRARTLRATQAWTQVSQPITETRFCTADTQCTNTVYTRDVASTADCYCPFCPTSVVTTATATTRERAYRRTCSTFRETCPVPRCAAPPAVGCVNHACAFAPLH
ncbi:MAG: DUF6748 domain-containing protein [Polyangiales bacterium]